ncbi:MAG: hypothetical protein J6V42_06905 [Clostridia bacterium]|nr:hypothetical protein [Clostridia bacterium]
MKKLLAVFLLCAILVTCFAGCGKKKDDKDDRDGSNQTSLGEFKIPAGMTGEDIAKLLLANERLNAALLKTDGDIFENGADIFRALAIKAEENLAASAVQLMATPMTYRSLEPVQTSTLLDEGKGKLELNGNVYSWSDFKEYNNSYDSFSSTTKGIVQSAEAAADMIDNIKKNVRVVDKWVKMGDSSFFLHVDENSEILLEKIESDGNTRLMICMRYKNDQGEDVYELFGEGGNPGEYTFYTRTTYIPGKRYEFSTRQEFVGGRVDENCFVADNSKGYWETYTVGNMTTHYNVSYFIMKDDISYDSFYDPVTQELNYLKVMSSDKATDIIHIMGNPRSGGIVFVDLLFSGFDGIKNIEIEAAPNEIVTDLEWYYGLSREEQEGYKLFANDSSYTILDWNYAVVNLTNGGQVRIGDSLLDGKVEVSALRVDAGDDRYSTGAIGLSVTYDEGEAVVDILAEIIETLGLTCRRDTDEVLAGIGRAYEELDTAVLYYKWNGIVVNTEDNIDIAYEIERQRFADMRAIADIAKDAEVIDYRNKEILALNVTFSDIELLETEGIVAENGIITVENVSLAVKDTLLFVEDEPYSVAFALVPTNGGGLVHIGSSEDSLAFTGGAFAVQGGGTFAIPHLSAGDYNLVAYLATSDGIRSTKYVKLSAESADGAVIKYNNMNMTARLGSDGSLVISFTENTDVYTELVIPEALGYAELRELVNMSICEYGIPTDALIEISADGEYTAMSGEETDIAEGEYRVKYERESSETLGRIEGYFYFSLLIDNAE